MCTNRGETAADTHEAAGKEEQWGSCQRSLRTQEEAKVKINLGVRYGARLRFGLSTGLDREIEFSLSFLCGKKIVLVYICLCFVC